MLAGDSWKLTSCNGYAIPNCRLEVGIIQGQASLGPSRFHAAKITSVDE